MTDYARIRALVEYSDFSDYGSPQTHSVSDTDTPVASFLNLKQSIGTSSENFSMSVLFSGNTVDYVLVKNTDTTNYVTVTWTSNADSNANSLRLAAGQFFIVPDVAAGTAMTFQANTAAVIVEISAIAS